MVRVFLERLFGGGHTLFIFKIGHIGAFVSKSAEIGQNPSILGLRGQKHRFLGGRRNALYNTWLAGSIADAFRSKIAFFKHRSFFGVLGSFSTQPKSGYFTESKAQSIIRGSFKNEKC